MEQIHGNFPPPPPPPPHHEQHFQPQHFQPVPPPMSPSGQAFHNPFPPQQPYYQAADPDITERMYNMRIDSDLAPVGRRKSTSGTNIVRIKSTNSKPQLAWTRKKSSSTGKSGGKVSVQRVSLSSRQSKSDLRSHSKDSRGRRGSDKDSDKGYRRGNEKVKDKAKTKDPDPFSNSRVFDGYGRPTYGQGETRFDSVGLPPSLPRDKPIGARPELEQPHFEPQPPPPMQELGGIEVLHDQLEGHPNDPLRGLSRDRRRRSQYRSRSRSRPGRRSSSRLAHINNPGRGSRLSRYFDGGSVSTESDRSNFMFEDEISSRTSEEIHNEEDRRRRNSKSYRPTYGHRRYHTYDDRDRDRFNEPERIFVPQSRPRDQRRLTYSGGEMDRDDRALIRRPPSPRRQRRQPPSLHYPDEINQRERDLDRRVRDYMDDTVLDETARPRRRSRLERDLEELNDHRRSTAPNRPTARVYNR